MKKDSTQEILTGLAKVRAIFQQRSIMAAMQIPRGRPPYGIERARELSTEDLKRLWDSYDGAETSDELISGEAVHMALNERREGSYCAV